MAGSTQPLTPEADVVRKRVWIGNGTATFIISCLVVLLTGSYVFAVTFFPTAATLGKEQQGIIVGALLTSFGMVVAYWVGSSLSSANHSIELAAKR